ncbi:hypothetical protein F5Y13DRAFT_153291 [Hypoxylon sp. FL1857]|nr:hypothetical protein F5Y13DRAFT_153291 [Hypoxylon sp. FL1857]
MLNVENIRWFLRNDMFAGLPAANSPAFAAIQYFLGQRYGATRQATISSVPVTLPANVDPAVVSQFNPGNAPIRNVTSVPTNRPSSPGPIQAVHSGQAPVANVVQALMNALPEGHPARPIVQNTVRPVPSHPNPAPIPVLSTIPFTRILNDGRLTARPIMRCFERKEGQETFCGKPASAVCEDTTHIHSGFPLCDDCELESRDRILGELKNLSTSLRSYACAECCRKFSTEPQRFANSGCRVWGFSSDLNSTVPIMVRLPRAPFTTVGGFQGVEPLPVTGCSCASKLIDRRLCSPHRLQHIVNLRQAADALDTHVMQSYGTTKICPSCRVLPSVDAFNFQGPHGNEGGSIVWFCKGCHDVVVAPNQHAPPVPLTQAAPWSPSEGLAGLGLDEELFPGLGS